MKFQRIVHGRTTAVVAGASVLALLGGVGGAVAHGMIDSGDIANQSIRAVDIQKNGVGKAELRDDSVGWFRELNDSTRQKVRSLAGEDGDPGLSGYEVVGPVTGPAPVTVPCPQGKVALGGGGWNHGADDPFRPPAPGYPAADGSGWIVGGYAIEATGYAVCAHVAQP